MDASPRQVVNVLAREGEYWTVVFGGRVSRVRDAKGLHYLSHLLRHPGEEMHALGIIAAVDPPTATGHRPSLAADALTAGHPGDAGPVLDATAVAAYRRRYRDLQEELADAEDRFDEARAARAQDEIDALSEQLAGGLGLGGRHRRAGSPAERARLAVTKAIRSAVRRLDQADPDLGRHLDRTVRTGTFCGYLPDPALQVVWQDRPAGDVPAAPAPRPVARRSRPPRTAFVGRALERGLMTEVVAAAAAGRGGLLLLSGEAGIGKTRLVEEALADAEGRAMGGFVGRCREAETALAWLPLIEVLEQVAGELDDAALLDLLGGSGPEVAKVLPALRRRFPDLPAPLDLPAEQGRQFLYATIRDLLLRLGAARPALVVLEDVHWADPATLHMVEHLVDGLADARVLVIATYRSDEAALGSPLARSLERLVRHPAATTLALGPLDTTEVAQLVATLTGRTPTATLVERLRADSDGNPFFVEELVKHLGADLDAAPAAVPAGLRLLLGHRLQRLSSACRDVVNLAAVVGRDVDIELLEAAAGGDDVEVVESVEDALAAGVLVAREEHGGDRLGFSHALLRQAALAELSAMRTRRLHRRVAEALRARHGDDPDHAGEVADHLLRAGDGVGATPFLELAGHRSLESAAYEDAHDRFRRVLALLPAEERGRRARVLAGLGYAQRGLGSSDAANASWLAALDLLEEDPVADTTLAADVCRSLGRYLDATGGLDDAITVLERGLRAVGTAPTADRSRLQSALGYAVTLHGDLPRGAGCIEDAAALAERLDDDRLRADVLASRTCLEFAAGRLSDCIVTADAAERALLSSGQVWDAVQAQVTTGWPRLWLGRVGDSARQVEETLRTAERVRHVAAVFLARRSAALLDFVALGDLERFTASAVEGVEFCRANRLRWLADALVLLGLAEFWAGNWDAADDHLRAATTAPVPAIYAGRYSATYLTFLAWRGDGEAFDRLLGQLHATFDRMGVTRTLGTMAVTLAEVEGQAVLGRTAAAAALYPEVAALLDEGLVLRPPDLRIVPALAGLAAGLAGDHTAAEAHFRQAHDLVTTLPHPRQQPDVDFLHALALGGGGPGRSRLEAAIAGYARLGMPGHRAKAEAAVRLAP